MELVSGQIRNWYPNWSMWIFFVISWAAEVSLRARRSWERWGQQAKKQRGEAGLHLRWGTEPPKSQPRPSLVPPGSHRESLSSTATSSRTTWPITTTTTTHEASRTVWRNNAGKRPRRSKGGTQIAGVGTLSETPCFGSSWVAPVASATITITLCLTLR